MPKRRRLIVGNWKMQGHLRSGVTLAEDIAVKAKAAASAGPLPYDVVLCPPATLLWPISEAILGAPVALGGQDCHPTTHGAHTGDISATMLADLGCRYVIVGHSERRAEHGETDELVARKVAAAQMAGLTAIVCIGETSAEQEAGKTADIVSGQFKHSLPDGVKLSSVVIAYEPVWAIGSGRQPAPAEIAKVHQLIRKEAGVAGDTLQILYGGSVNPSNAAAIFELPDVDGALVGGASLNADGFWAIADKSR